MTLSSEEARHEALDRPKRRRKAATRPHGGGVHGGFRHRPTARGEHKPRAVGATRAPHPATLRGRLGAARWAHRSEERRVGKEGRSRWSRDEDREKERRGGRETECIIQCEL